MGWGVRVGVGVWVVSLLRVEGGAREAPESGGGGGRVFGFVWVWQTDFGWRVCARVYGVTD